VALIAQLKYNIHHCCVTSIW